jgi:hypothetical protein
MPIRKKHVRRLIALAMGLLVLVPLSVLAGWALWLRGEGPARGLRQHLEARLRCTATVRGYEPEGLDRARLEELELRWDLGGGRVETTLSGIRAERQKTGDWHLVAETGRLDVSGGSPRRTLDAWSQRLVQLDDVAIPLGRIEVSAFAVSVESRRLRLAEVGRLSLRELDEGTYAAEFDSSSDGDGDAAGRETDVEAVLAPGAASGVFRRLEGRARGLTLGDLAAALPDWRLGTAPAGRVAVHYRWDPQAGEGAQGGERLEVSGESLDLAPLTESLPGGSISGAADLRIVWVPTAADRAKGGLSVSLSAAETGLIGGGTLRWLEGLSPSFEGCGELVAGRIGYELLGLDVQVGPRGLARFERSAGSGDRPLVTTRLFGEYVPLLWSGTETFDAAAAWAELRAGLAPAMSEE